MAKVQRILLIEPDVELAHTYAGYLSGQGMDIRVAYSAQDAVLCIDECMPDVIVLEPQMAAHNGIEFLYECRSYAEWRQIPIIIMSMIAEHQLLPSTMLAEQLGVGAYLYKPSTTLARLAQAVRNVNHRKIGIV